MPGCCSSRIQSEVAWRVALRPLTVPAIWMAPPNSRSFSVRVVLPASGWEMMANVLRRLISLEISASVTNQDPLVYTQMYTDCKVRNSRRVDGWLFYFRHQHSPQHRRILAAHGRLIVPAPHSHLLETHRMIEAGGG